ncbi:hypothetical protein PTTG_06941 [Puccinia triticina 1-1 BBBD Race 1]|uniref:Uncharacterized protein n=1 Tax=Puccinia triticina (isolate 1-1 / race 1 (BBBD)) TaxID=630390 RepID=A0A180GRE5_PUCT1|nr:hypothetical protein PTTG_06941 [Puccinia triticina 1-1 BBBD Race 1]
MKLLRTHSLPFEKIVKCRANLTPSFSKMEWNHAIQLWPQYKVITDIPEYNPIEPYIPKTFAAEVFRAIEKAEVDTSQSGAADNEARVAVLIRVVRKNCPIPSPMPSKCPALFESTVNRSTSFLTARKILVEISSLFSGAVSNDAEGYIAGTASSQGRIESIYTVLGACVNVVLEVKAGGIRNRNFAQMMAELESCDMLNVSRQLNLNTLQGVLSSQTEWHFWAYDRRGFTVSEAIAPYHRDEKQEIMNRLKIVARLFGQFLKGYCPALHAFIRRSEGKGFQEQQEHSPSYNEWKKASSLAEAAQAKAFSAKGEQDFAVVRSLLNQSYDALPHDCKRPLRFPTQSNIIDECIEELQCRKT